MFLWLINYEFKLWTSKRFGLQSGEFSWENNLWFVKFHDYFYQYENRIGIAAAVFGVGLVSDSNQTHWLHKMQPTSALVDFSFSLKNSLRSRHFMSWVVFSMPSIAVKLVQNNPWRSSWRSIRPIFRNNEPIRLELY